MSKIVFRLHNVPQFEADAVRALLSDHQLYFHETDAGRWGISVAALWVESDVDFIRARELINAFQKTHTIKARAEYEQAKQDGSASSFKQMFYASPLRYLSYGLLILAVLALTIFPVIYFFY